MAPPRLYELPLQQLARLMHEARARGIPFEQAWEEALRPGKPLVMTTTAAAPATAIRWPTDRTDRVGWQEAVEGTREAWRRAYEQLEPDLGERALMTLSEVFSRVDEKVLVKLAAAGGRQAGSEGIASDPVVSSAA